MTLHDTSKIKQRPVTDGMTDEQLQEYKKMVREERHGNPGNAWDHIAGGISYRVEEKPLSDDLRYGSFAKEERKRLHEEHETLAARQDKHKQIEKWKEYIERMNARIKQIQADKTLPVLTKQKKIQNCINRIKEYQDAIDRTQTFLAEQAAKEHMQYEKYMKTK